jgi:hypothetical protein
VYYNWCMPSKLNWTSKKDSREWADEDLPSRYPSCWRMNIQPAVISTHESFPLLGEVRTKAMMLDKQQGVWQAGIRCQTS